MFVELISYPTMLNRNILLRLVLASVNEIEDLFTNIILTILGPSTM